MVDHGRQTGRGMVNRLIDSEVNKTLFSEMGWQRQQAYGEGKTGLRKKRTKFGTSCNLPILERVKCELTAAGSATAQTIIYVSISSCLDYF